MNRKYKLRILAILATIALFFAVDRLGAKLIDGLLLRSQFRYSKLYRGEIKSDVVVMGNSRAINSIFVPELKKQRPELNCFNLAYNGIGSYEQLRLFEDLLAKNEKPKLVLIEATCLKPSTRNSNLRPFWHHSPGLTEDASGRYAKMVRTGKLSHLYRFNTEMTYRTLYFSRRSDQDSINRYSISQAVLEQETNSKESESLVLPNAENMKPLIELVALAKQNDVTVRFFVAPYLPEYKKRMNNFDEWKSEFEARIGDYRLYDFSDSMQESEHFADRVHSNLKGAPSLTTRLLKSGIFDLQTTTKEATN